MIVFRVKAQRKNSAKRDRERKDVSLNPGSAARSLTDLVFLQHDWNSSPSLFLFFAIPSVSPYPRLLATPCGNKCILSKKLYESRYLLCT